MEMCMTYGLKDSHANILWYEKYAYCMSEWAECYSLCLQP